MNITNQFDFQKVAIIMAGGMGARLWPRSTEKQSKQFIHLIGDGTMIQNTVARLQPCFSPEEIYIVAAESYSELIYDQIPLLPKENIILEPYGKNTAPCLALSLTQISEKISPETVVYALPADHVIYNVREYHNSLNVAGKLALDRKCIATIGIHPTRPETGFGYVQVDDEPGDLGEAFEFGIRHTKTFAEKPDEDTAQRFIDSGDFLWNSGIFTWRADTFWEAFEKYLPEHDQLFKVLRKFVGKEMYSEAVQDVYRQILSESVDYAILEKAKNVYVVEGSFGWSDVGNWDELYRLTMKDGRNNVIEGDVIAIDTSNCFISSYDKTIGTVGVENLIIVDSEDALLICRKGNSSAAKEIVDFMKRKHISKY